MVSTIKIGWESTLKMCSVCEKHYADIHRVVILIDDQGYTIENICNTMLIASKEINVMSTTMDVIGRNLQNVEKEIEL